MQKKFHQKIAVVIKQLLPSHFHLLKLGGLVIVVQQLKIKIITKYVDLEINEENLFSCRIGKKIDIEKNEAIDLLTEKIDFDSLVLSDSLNLHYNN